MGHWFGEIVDLQETFDAAMNLGGIIIPRVISSSATRSGEEKKGSFH
jgi:hypothetical protein